MRNPGSERMPHAHTKSKRKTAEFFNKKNTAIVKRENQEKKTMASLLVIVVGIGW
jgi:hypothetical protein